MRRGLALALLSIALSACGTSKVCAGEQLAAASSPRTEAEAMEAFWSQCSPLSMSAYDASGERLSFSDATWMDEVHSVEIRGDGGTSFRHTVLDAENLGILMRE